ncbi:hypothetical protein K431DRAFT_280188 [Polychaeton citri CBS 116435]|uniref:Uncharacterized protein n=1 Tax=Polychaeton citri CBS 116435 TaxID=1314669 RepID=A0A9P4UVG9_9PEZI|nr:hypothetical protein K431DRAFT_280188 [Polychaeton citri CBS 116435]
MPRPHSSSSSSSSDSSNSSSSTSASTSTTAAAVAHHTAWTTQYSPYGRALASEANDGLIDRSLPTAPRVLANPSHPVPHRLPAAPGEKKPWRTLVGAHPARLPIQSCLPLCPLQPFFFPHLPLCIGGKEAPRILIASISLPPAIQGHHLVRWCVRLLTLSLLSFDTPPCCVVTRHHFTAQGRHSTAF